MIRAAPDPSLTMARLEQAVRDLRAEAATAPAWVFRETYVDRGRSLDPHYLIEFRSEGGDVGDDLWDEPTFVTGHPALRMTRVTREKTGEGQAYWRPIDAAGLDRRLQRFLTLFREDALQPPGAMGDLYHPDRAHERFAKKRFLYEITSPRTHLIGVGPKSFAGVFGALRGRVVDESGMPLAGATVLIGSGEQVITRKTNAQGEFWVSRLPAGPARLRVKDKAATVRVVEAQCFGHIKTTIADAQGGPMPAVAAEFQAPDGEVFGATTDDSGKATTGPLPAFPYIARIPGFLFTATARVVSDGEIAGTLFDEAGRVMAGQPIVLSQDGGEVARHTTDPAGRFAFTGLRCGWFGVSVPGHVLYLRSSGGAGVTGRLNGASGPVVMELVAQGQTVAAQVVQPGGSFRFDGLRPGEYALRAKDHLLAKGGRQ